MPEHILLRERHVLTSCGKKVKNKRNLNKAKWNIIVLYIWQCYIQNKINLFQCIWWINAVWYVSPYCGIVSKSLSVLMSNLVQQTYRMNQEGSITESTPLFLLFRNQCRDYVFIPSTMLHKDCGPWTSGRGHAILVKSHAEDAPHVSDKGIT